MPRPKKAIKSNTIAKPAGLKQGSAPHIWRWMPAPKLRAAGWQATTLKQRDDTHMDFPDAFRAATEINAMIKAWYDNAVVPSGPWAFLAPASIGRAAPKPVANSIGDLLDEWLAKAIVKKSPRTQKNYRQFMSRFLEVLAGHVIPPHRQDLPAPLLKGEMEGYERDLARVRNLRITALLPREDDETSPLQQVYQDIVDAGVELGTPMLHTANAIMTTVSTWLTWVVKKKRKLPYNPVQAVDREAAQGRVVIWEPDEFKAVVDAADALGWRSIAFGMKLSRELSWSRQDVLALTLSQFREDTTYDAGGNPRRRVRVAGTRLKTGNTTWTTLTRDGMAVYDAARAWRQKMLGDAVLLPSLPLLVCDLNVPDWNTYEAGGKMWKGNYFARIFRLCRAEAAVRMDNTDLLAKRFADLRDTAITEMNAAGLTRHHKISRSQHSLESADSMDQKHYGLTTPEISDEAADLIQARRDRLAGNMCDTVPIKTQK